MNPYTVTLLACLFPLLARLNETSAEQPVAIELSDLPTPPDSLEKLIKVGQVRFTTGPRETPTDPGKLRLAAETTYNVKYDYRSRSRWNVRQVGGRRRLVITVRFSSVSLAPTHVVWFRRPPRTSDFWQQKLVLHEMDHVMISSDARLTKRFKEMLQDQNVIETDISGSTAVDSRLVNRLIDEHVKEVFDEVLQLVSIRYRELDRVTSHGLRPLPESSSLHEILRKPDAGE